MDAMVIGFGRKIELWRNEIAFKASIQKAQNGPST
jgi:hypothetical protein